MLLKWNCIFLSILTVAGVVVLARGRTLPDTCATTTADRSAETEMRDEAALAERLATLDAALARQDLSRAIYEWRDAYGLALRSRGWDAMAAVGDAAVRVNALMGGSAGHSNGFQSEARRAYIHALLRAQRQQSREGVDHIADGLVTLGDADMAAHARTLRMRR
jgi:hypothetical protein